MISIDDIQCVEFGWLAPTGGTRQQPRPVLGYLVRYPQGLLLFDTGIGPVDPKTENHYKPIRTPLSVALRRHGVWIDDITIVINCHLHFDHCGGNAELAGRPIVVQAMELEEASRSSYLAPGLLDFTGNNYHQLKGETELLAGVWVIPSPGHTRGHQSLVIRCTDGTVVLAGQSHNSVHDYIRDTCEISSGGSIGPRPEWLDRILHFDPSRVLFAHDSSAWTVATFS